MHRRSSDMRHKSVAEERPEIRAQWAPINKLSPDQVSCGSHLKVWWICSEGHKWQATVKNRALLGSGCPYCEHKRPILGETDLRSHNPELLEEWNYERNQYPPEHYSYGSIAKVWWRCKYGHEWRTVIQHRTRGPNCPICHREGR